MDESRRKGVRTRNGKRLSSLRTCRLTPRPAACALDPAGTTLYAANRGSDSIASFRITQRGRLEPIGRTVSAGSPVCVVLRTEEGGRGDARIDDGVSAGIAP